MVALCIALDIAWGSPDADVRIFCCKLLKKIFENYGVFAIRTDKGGGYQFFVI